MLGFSSLPLFLGALLSDWAYAASFQVQWTNFAAWLIAAGLVLTGAALLWAALAQLLTRGPRPRGAVLYLLLLLASFVVGVINALVHARDAWAAMPAGLVLSGVVLLLMTAASAVGLARWRRAAPR